MYQRLLVAWFDAYLHDNTDQYWKYEEMLNEMETMMNRREK